MKGTTRIIKEDSIRITCFDYYNSPRLVTQVGKEHLLQTPAWRVRTLDDGSVLLIPEFMFVPRGPETKQGDLAAQHLGLHRFLRGRYLPAPASQHG